MYTFMCFYQFFKTFKYQKVPGSDINITQAVIVFTPAENDLNMCNNKMK